MPQTAPIERPMPPLTAEAQNDNTVQVLKEYADQIVVFCEDLIENPPAPAIKLKPKQRWLWFRDNLAQTYYTGGLAGAVQPGFEDLQAFPEFYDVLSMSAEIDLLMRDDLTDGIKQSLYPIPLSRPFINYVPGLLLGLEAWARVFRKLERQYGDHGGKPADVGVDVANLATGAQTAATAGGEYTEGVSGGV